ncbi:hypothetical protein CHEID_01595 [Corynebacterium heidelbergense]|uniref:Uncharacterized protein n=2 Tax=Corynebacterium heidelbergense TaxID=2055947 RepID=A0A364VE85_9CORY|nr:hypothetical protein CWC39_00490 [Corynebacterium heidelbergense]WCZ35897.1 hypothetical protein CHEID_01595 [Corynebacterium heidelbergense]
MTNQITSVSPSRPQGFTSGRELINAVVARRLEAEDARGLFASVDKTLPDASALDGDRIEGVKVLWISPGRAARDETVFRHALATAHRLREADQRMTDAKIIDAYEYAYNVAQAVGADHRSSEMPPQRDRQTMARRVRGYVLSGSKTSRGSAFTGATAGVSARERKALSTMGRKGGKKAAQRWNDRNSTYAQNELNKLAKANQQRARKGRVSAREIANFFDDAYLQTGTYPTLKQASSELKVSEKTV